MELSPRTPDLAALVSFLAVARTGSINAAARELDLSQQAVSARMAAMEVQTGVQLLSRTPRGTSLTPAGVVVAEWATRVVAAAADLDRGLATLRQDRQTRLRVAASLTVAELLLPGWLVSFDAARRNRGQPHVDVVLAATNSEQVVARVHAGETDVGFIETPRQPRGLRSAVVAHDRLVLVARPDHRLARRRRPLTPAELAAVALVSREEGSGTRQALSDALRDVLGPETGQAQPAMALTTTSAIRSAVLAGAGPAVLSELSVADDVRTGRLSAVEVAGVDLRRSLRAVWDGPPRPPAGAVRDLIAHIRSLDSAS